MNASDKLPRSGYIQTIYEYLLGLIKKLDPRPAQRSERRWDNKYEF